MATDQSEESAKRWEGLRDSVTQELQRSELGIFMEKKNFGSECTTILFEFLGQNSQTRDPNLCVQRLLAVKLDGANPQSKAVADVVSRQGIEELVSRCNLLN